MRTKVHSPTGNDTEIVNIGYLYPSPSQSSMIHIPYAQTNSSSALSYQLATK